MFFLRKYIYVYFSKIEKRNFGRVVEPGLKPSALRIKRGENKNFNDIINKYYPNRVLKNKKKEIKEVDPNEKFYLSSKISRANKLKELRTNRDGNLLTSDSKSGEKNIQLDRNDVTVVTNSNEVNAERQPTEVLEITKEEHEIQKYKNRLHKKIWLSLKKKNEKEFEQYFNELNKYPLKDEVSYSILLHGNLIISKGKNIKESFSILEEMKKNKVQCSLIRFNERLLFSYYELLKVKTPPNFHQWIKVLRTVWFTSALVKARRQKFILRKIKKMKKDNYASLSNFNDIFNIHNVQTLYIDNKDPLLPTHIDVCHESHYESGKYLK